MFSWCGVVFIGGVFGFGNFISGVWWFYISMYVYGEMVVLFVGGVFVLFLLYLLLYLVFLVGLWLFCVGYVWYCCVFDLWLFLLIWYGVFVFVSVWVFGEWLCGIVFIGFLWFGSGYL